jgi:hypothetical protein
MTAALCITGSDEFPMKFQQLSQKFDKKSGELQRTPISRHFGECGQEA